MSSTFTALFSLFFASFFFAEVWSFVAKLGICGWITTTRIVRKRRRDRARSAFERKRVEGPRGGKSRPYHPVSLKVSSFSVFCRHFPSLTFRVSLLFALLFLGALHLHPIPLPHSGFPFACENVLPAALQDLPNPEISYLSFALFFALFPSPFLILLCWTGPI